MIQKSENETHLRFCIGEHPGMQISVSRDASGDGQLILDIRRSLPFLGVTAFLTFNEARELAEALTAAAAEWTPEQPIETIRKE